MSVPLFSVVLVVVCLASSASALAKDGCKPPAPLPQSRCVQDRQCCGGLVCAPGCADPVCEPQRVCQPGCRIDGRLYASGELNVSNPCQSCAPTVSTTAWTYRANGTPCDDGNACSLADTCISGACSGSALICDIQDQCHERGQCDPQTGSCSNPPKPNGTPCVDSDLCTNDTCWNGACTGTSEVSCAPLDHCHESGVCDPSTGNCSNPTVGCSDDNNDCTVDECDPAVGCVHVPVPDGTVVTATCKCEGGDCLLCEDDDPTSCSFYTTAGTCRHVVVTIPAGSTDVCGNPNDQYVASGRVECGYTYDFDMFYTECAGCFPGVNRAPYCQVRWECCSDIFGCGWFEGLAVATCEE